MARFWYSKTEQWLGGNPADRRKSYAIFVAATGPDAGRNYLPDVNSLLNSIQKTRLWEQVDGDLTVYLLHHGFPAAWQYPEKACKTFEFNLVALELTRGSLPFDTAAHNTIEFVKRARYFMMREIATRYDAVCLLDADMYIVSPEFGSMFDLVGGTRKMIAANERTKWTCGPGAALDYWLDGERIFPEPARLHGMVCNVPCIFDAKCWGNMLDYYCRIAFDGYQFKGGHRVGIGDLFAHNTAIHKAGRSGDVITFPMGCMAQVHHVWRSPFHHIVVDGDKWRTWDGDRIYLIHDTKKLCTCQFVPGNMYKYHEENEGWKHCEKFAGGVERGLRAVQREWWDLNFNQRLSLYEFLPQNEFWDSLKGD